MNIRTYTRLMSLALLALLAYAPATYAAGQATAQFNVTATVGQICSVTANPLAFGDYDGSATPGVTTISVNCTHGLGYSVGLGDGFWLNTATGERRMKHAGSDHFLRYQLFSDGARSVVWNTAHKVTGLVGTGMSEPLTVYGRIIGGQTGRPDGNYSDTITVTVDY